MNRIIIIFPLILLCLSWNFITKTLWGEEDSDPWEDSLNLLQPPVKVMDTMGLKAGMEIGEIGAGSEHYAVKLADRVGNKGKVYANDILESELEYLNKRCKRNNINNIVTVLGSVTNPRFPESSLDFAFLINTYHHIEKPVELLINTVPALKPRGKLVVVEREPKKSGVRPPIATEPEVLLKNAQDAGFQLVRIETFLKNDNIYIFQVKENRPQ